MPVHPRVVVPEILDGLAHDDPDAVASRRDLRRVNAVMGNPRFVLRKARQLRAIAVRGITEVGAGDGHLALALARAFPQTRVTAVDLAPAPDGEIPEQVDWRQIDLFEAARDLPTGGLLVACLFLHHFKDEPLRELGRELLAKFDAVVVCEPDRCRLAHVLGRLAWPFINRVTRHDMHVSIDAGFTRGELPERLGLDPTVWQVDESHTIAGARRLVAVRRSERI